MLKTFATEGSENTEMKRFVVLSRVSMTGAVNAKASSGFSSVNSVPSVAEDFQS
jgi:hypothetical protein